MPISIPASATRHTGGCLQPVLLRGRADYIDGGTGELIHRYTTVHEPGGVLPIACKTRRASRCPPCAEVYRADTYQLIHAGLTGGKGIPATVADHPCVFVTLTAPSFGPVHARREKDGRVLACRPRRKDKTCPHGIRLSCGQKHARDDAAGEPPGPDCYDYTGAVVFNACAPGIVAPVHHHPRRPWPAAGHWQGPRCAGPRPMPRWPNTAGGGPLHAIIRLTARRTRRRPPAWATVARSPPPAARASGHHAVAPPSQLARWAGAANRHPPSHRPRAVPTPRSPAVACTPPKPECAPPTAASPRDRLAHLPVRDHACTTSPHACASASSPA